ncbi:hypothetical protein ACQJBY_042281 [Aegilops geniculata]
MSKGKKLAHTSSPFLSPSGPSHLVIAAAAAAATAPDGRPGGDDYLSCAWSTSLTSLMRQRLGGAVGGARSGRARQDDDVLRRPSSPSTVLSSMHQQQSMKNVDGEVSDILQIANRGHGR